MSSPAEETCETDFHSYLTVVDYVVFAMVLAFSALIGIVYWLKDRNKESAENFLMADRQMSVLPVTLSLLASFMSAITLLGNVLLICYSAIDWQVNKLYCCYFKN
jgi:Na+(H+)/acetate symporter ActP